jgi:hypothetical protein
MALVGLAALTVWVSPLRAGPISIPKFSFESPVAPANPGALPQIDSWQQVPTWDYLQSGVFLNGAGPYFIVNCDSNQAAFLFVATNQTAFFQDYDSTDWSTSVPSHAFNATYDVGKSYTLTVAVLGGTNVAYPMTNGTILNISLYYRDTHSQMVTVAATSVTNSWALFSNSSNAPFFLDFQAQVPTVKANDPWAGQHIGVQLASPGVTTNLLGGYWDLDNVRLSSTVTPVLLNPVCTNNQFTFTLQSEPGSVFKILATTNLALPRTNWSQLGNVTNTSGITAYSNSTTGFNYRFYSASQLQ